MNFDHLDLSIPPVPKWQSADVNLPKKQRKIAKGKGRMLCLLLAIAILFLAPAKSRAQESYSQADLSYIVKKLQNNHLSRLPYNNKLARSTLEQYLTILDAERSYFLAADVKEFQGNIPQLVNDLPRGQVKLAFAIHKRFKKRLLERKNFIEKLLKKPVVVIAPQKIWLDRSAADWPRSRTDAEKIWQARLYHEQLKEQSSGKSSKETLETLRRRYRSVWLRHQQLKDKNIVSLFLNAYAYSYDPHSAYLNQDDLDNFNIAMRLSLEGIGATLRWEDGYTVVNTIVPGGAAARHKGLKPADRIVAVGQGRIRKMEDVTHQPLGEVVKLIRGKRGTIVRLSLIRETGEFTKSLKISIRRDKIELKESEAQSSIHQLEMSSGMPSGMPSEMPAGTIKIGVIVLPSFYQDFAQKRRGNRNYKSSTRDVKKILASFVDQSIDAVLLDLRGNSGGSLDEAINMSNLFIPKSVMVKVRYLKSVSSYDGKQKQAFYKGPLVVLIDRFSASASEIVAGALKDYGRAVLVGDSSTFGKGTVQNIITLRKDLGALRATVAQFYRPSHSSTQKKGVVPDIIFPSLNSHLDIGEAALKNALPWDALPDKISIKANNIAPLATKLKALSEKRRKTNPHFKDIRQEIREYITHRKNKTTISVAGLQTKYKKQQKKKNDADNQQKDDPLLLEALNITKDYLQLLKN